MITQWHIDSLLSTISLKTSPTAPSCPKELPKRTFMSLVQLMQSILTGHRNRIKGRYHLVVPALNGLLRCLFHPYVSESGTVEIPQPAWLYPRDCNPDRSPLNEADAKGFARLLTTICEPAPGAVKPARSGGRRNEPNRQLLNDHVKNARAIAGQHLQ